MCNILTTMLVMTTIFISKMEGLPPTSDTKIIDYWLILCPLIQVVLVTIKEYLKEEEQENTLEKDDLQLLKSTEDDPEITAEDDILPNEAWTTYQGKVSKASSVSTLTMIGGVQQNIFSFQKRKCYH